MSNSEKLTQTCSQAKKPMSDGLQELPAIDDFKEKITLQKILLKKQQFVYVFQSRISSLMLHL